ncbi:hypothetical protein [Rhodocaloribacter sp.]
MKSTPEHSQHPSRREASNVETHLTPPASPRKVYTPPALVSQGRLTIHAGSLNLWSGP